MGGEGEHSSGAVLLDNTSGFTQRAYCYFLCVLLVEGVAGVAEVAVVAGRAVSRCARAEKEWLRNE